MTHAGFPPGGMSGLYVCAALGFTMRPITAAAKVPLARSVAKEAAVAVAVVAVGVRATIAIVTCVAPTASRLRPTGAWLTQEETTLVTLYSASIDASVAA